MTRWTCFAAALAVALPTSALAQVERPDHDALVAPLRALTPSDLERAAPLLDLGVFGMVEHDAPPLLPAIHFAVRVDAPCHVVADVLSRPERFPEFMPAVSSVEVRERDGSSIAYDWQWQTSVFQLGGRAMMTTFAPRPGQEARGWRIAVERTDGDLGHGREVWRIRADGPHRSIVSLSTRMDLTDANYVTRQLRRGGRSLSRSITMVTGLSMILRARREAERRVGRAPRTLDHALRRPEVDIAPLEPLLRRGDLLLIEATADDFRQSTVFTRYERRESQVRSIILDPVAFSEALINGSTSTVTSRPDPRTVEFAWRYDMPLVGADGTMRLHERDDRVIELDATEGAMEGGRWRFETSRLPSGATGVMGWARFDVAGANFLLRAITEADPGFAVGLSASTEVMMARAVRIRVHRLGENEEHAPAR